VLMTWWWLMAPLAGEGGDEDIQDELALVQMLEAEKGEPGAGGCDGVGGYRLGGA